MKSMKPGGGGRFEKLEEQLEGSADNAGEEKAERVKNPGALAASIGRKKYGKKRFQEMAAKGRKRSAKQADSDARADLTRNLRGE